MKRSLAVCAPLATSVAAWIAPTPAVAMEYYADDGLVWTSVCAIWACVGVFALVSLVFWIWMLVDLLARQEHEFPGATGNTKLTWVVIMFASWLLGAPLVAAIAYYFLVFKKVKRGTLPPPGTGPYSGYPQGGPAAPYPSAPPPAPPSPPPPPTS